MTVCLYFDHLRLAINSMFSFTLLLHLCSRISFWDFSTIPLLSLDESDIMGAQRFCEFLCLGRDKESKLKSSGVSITFFWFHGDIQTLRRKNKLKCNVSAEWGWERVHVLLRNRSSIPRDIRFWKYSKVVSQDRVVSESPKYIGLSSFAGLFFPNKGR